MPTDTRHNKQIQFRIPPDVEAWLDAQRQPGESIGKAASRLVIAAAHHDEADTLTADDLAAAIVHYARRLAAMVPKE